jgi:hypothetical protein
MPTYSLNGTNTTRIFFIIISTFPDAELAFTINTTLAVAFLCCVLNPRAVKTDAQKITSERCVVLYNIFHNY